MTVLEGPGGPTTEDADRHALLADTFERLATYSPEAAWNVLVGLSAQLRQHDLEIAHRWSEGVETELLD